MSPESVAVECLDRIQWRFPSIPSPNTLAQHLGIVVTRLPVHYAEKLDGLSYVEGDAWAVFLNGTQSWVRRQWTLTHEIGHILLHYEHRGQWYRGHASPNAPMEREADRFARAFLMPASLMQGLVAHYGPNVAELAGSWP